MKFTARYPALVNGRTSRMKSDKLILCLPEQTFEVPEIASGEAPVALIATANEQVTEYRFHGGKLFTRLEDGDSLAKLNRYGDVSLIREGHPVFGSLAREIRNFLGHSRDPSETRPERLYVMIGQSGVDDAIVVRAATDAISLVETEEAAGDLDRWRSKAAERIGEFILIDGCAWEEAPEPCYQLNVDVGLVHVVSGELFGKADPRGYETYKWSNLAYRYFSGLDMDRLRDCAGRVLEVSWTKNDHMEVLLPEALTTNFRDREIDRFARVCVANIETHVGSEIRKNANSLRTMPADLLLSAARLRDHLSGRSKFDAVTEQLVDSLLDHGEILACYPEIMKRMNFEEHNMIKDVVVEWRAETTPFRRHLLAPACS